MVLNTLAVSPQGTGEVTSACFSELPGLTHVSHGLNPHKSLQHKALSSSKDFSLDLGHTLCSKPKNNSLGGCLRGRGWPHTKQPARCQCCFFGTSLQPLPLPCATTSPCPAQVATGRGWVFWGIRDHPTGPHRTFHYALQMSACCGLLFVFPHRRNFLAAPNCFLTDVGMFFLPGAKLYPCPHTAASLEKAEHPPKSTTPPIWPPRHRTTLPREGFPWQGSINHHQPSGTCDGTSHLHPRQPVLSAPERNKTIVPFDWTSHGPTSGFCSKEALSNVCQD